MYPPTFEFALAKIKEGKLLASESLSVAFIFLIPGSNFQVNRHPLDTILPRGMEVKYRPHIGCCFTDGTFGEWSPTNEALLADDWHVLSAPAPAEAS